MSTPRIGDSVGPYCLERLIDDTGRSQVWIAHDDRLDRNVALKIRARTIDGDEATRGDRFDRAARIAAKVEHPGVIAVFESGATTSHAYLAMRYVPGRDLELWLPNNQKASTETRFQLLSPIAEALDHAHAMGIAHGSVALANIIVDESTSPPRGALAQFGRGAEADLYASGSARAIEADRLAFAQVLTAAFGGSAPLVDSTTGGNASCVDLLRKTASLTSADPAPTPATVVRTRRAHPRRRRLTVIATAAVTILVVGVGALELLQDGAALVSPSNEPAATPAPSATETPSAIDGAAADAVLILGTHLTPMSGALSKQNRKPVFRMRSGVNAADVVEAALLENPATSQLDTVVVPLTGSSAACRTAVQDALDARRFAAIVVLESPCTVTVARLLVANEAMLPPTYWIDLGDQSDDIWSFLVSSPPVGDKVPAYRSGTDTLESIVGAHSGQRFARLLPGNNYLDVGHLARSENLSETPCFYLASRDVRREDASAEFGGFEDFRIASSIVELAAGFDAKAPDIDVAELVLPQDEAGRYVLPANGTLTGSELDDSQIIEKIKSADPGCILAELPVSQPAWSLRMVNKLATTFPDISILQLAHPADPFSSGTAPPAGQQALWTKVMNHPSVYSLSQAPYVSLDAPLGAHFDSVVDRLYEPVDYDRREWWFANDYALVLAAELIGAQPAGSGNRRPGFGRLDATMWATPEEDFVTDSAPVEVNEQTHVYSGYLVHVYHEGKAYTQFYGGTAD